MTHSSAMLDASPSSIGFEQADLVACLDSCFDCAQSCTACADACLAEDSVADLRSCITLNLNCADVCVATGRTLSRQAAYDPAMSRAILDACADACRLCGAECSTHGEHMAHCQVCAEACRRCEHACRQLLAA